VQRFRARIRKQGINPYVDVPERTSRAFAGMARAGRIAFDGELNGVPIRGTLVPIRGGRHRLFVHGGMRGAAGVEVGDTARFALRAHAPEAVELPTDIATGLRRVKGATAAFAALPPSRRRELIRYIDAAARADTRRKRIADTAEHVMGRAKPRPVRADRPLWTCPRCGHDFVTRNMSHSCARHELGDAFAGKPPFVRELFDRLRAMVEGFGPVTLVPYRDKVAFMVRVRFGGAVPRRGWLEVAFWLPRRFDHPRFTKVETLYPTAHVYRLRVTDARDLDPELEGWLREAYAVGCQRYQYR